MKTIRTVFDEKISRTRAEIAGMAAAADEYRRKAAEIDHKAKELHTFLVFLQEWQKEVSADEATTGSGNDRIEPRPPTSSGGFRPAEPENNHLESLPSYAPTTPPNPLPGNMAVVYAGTASVPQYGVVTPGASPVARESVNADVVTPAYREVAEPVATVPAPQAIAEPAAVSPVVREIAEADVVSESYTQAAVAVAERDSVSSANMASLSANETEDTDSAPIQIDTFTRNNPGSLNMTNIARLIMRRAEQS